MSLLLLIETATTSCSVALANHQQVIALHEIDQRNIHAEVITIYINEVCQEAGKQLADIDAVAVSAGPGSYTGLRIGVSTAKGLCFSLERPLITIETLSAMAHGLIARGDIEMTTDTLLCPMIDARRMEVYTALFDSRGNAIRPTTAEIIDADSFSDVLLKSRVIFFGDGAEKCKAVLSHQPNAIFADGFSNSARDLFIPALTKFTDKAFADVAYFEPFYLKDFIAGVKKQ